MTMYRSNRTKKVKLLRAELSRISADQNKALAAETEVTRIMRLIPAEANSSAFVESLYRAALESGLKQHDVSTEADKSSATARPGGSDTTSTVVKQRYKISAIGSYRSFAEYIRKVQNTERFNRIIDFKLAPDTTQLKGTLTIELYSLPVIR
jgi:Tfp pilus assembly protein PilO